MRRITRQADYDRCRAVGHKWDEVSADRPPEFGYYMWFRCESCNMIRRDIVDRFGQLLSRNYDQPEGYRDTEGFTRSDYRLRLLSRHIEIGARPVGAPDDWTDVKAQHDYAVDHELREHAARVLSYQRAG